MLDEGLKDIEEGAGAESVRHLQHFDLSFAGPWRQGMVLHEHAREYTHLERCTFDGLTHTIKLLEVDFRGLVASQFLADARAQKE